MERNSKKVFGRSNYTFPKYITKPFLNLEWVHPLDFKETIGLLDLLLAEDYIDTYDFLIYLKNMSKKLYLINAFMIEELTTAGKTLMLKIITSNYISGTVQKKCGHSWFFL